MFSFINKLHQATKFMHIDFIFTFSPHQVIFIFIKFIFIRIVIFFFIFLCF